MEYSEGRNDAATLEAAATATRRLIDNVTGSLSQPAVDVGREVQS